MAQPQPAILDELVRVSGDLDQVIATLQLGHPHDRRTPQRDHDAIVDRVEDLARRMREAVRGPSPRPTAAPLWSSGSGQAAW